MERRKKIRSVFGLVFVPTDVGAGLEAGTAVVESYGRALVHLEKEWVSVCVRENVSVRVSERESEKRASVCVREKTELVLVREREKIEREIGRKIKSVCAREKEREIGRKIKVCVQERKKER